MLWRKVSVVWIRSLLGMRSGKRGAIALSCDSGVSIGSCHTHVLSDGVSCAVQVIYIVI